MAIEYPITTTVSCDKCGTEREVELTEMSNNTFSVEKALDDIGWTLEWTLECDLVFCEACEENRESEDENDDI